MSQPYKECPQCKMPAALQELTCQRCGHVFRTVFQSAPQKKRSNAAIFCCAVPFGFAILFLIAIVTFSRYSNNSTSNTNEAMSPTATVHPMVTLTSDPTASSGTPGAGIFRGSITNISGSPLSFLVVAAEYELPSGHVTYRLSPVPSNMADTAVYGYRPGRPIWVDIGNGETALWGINPMVRDVPGMRLYVPRRDSMVGLHVFRLYSKSGKDLRLYGNQLGWRLDYSRPSRNDTDPWPADVGAEEIPFDMH